MNTLLRTAVASIASLALGASGVLAAGTVAHGAGTGAHHPTTALAPSPVRTRLTVEVHGCNGCRITPVQALTAGSTQWRGRSGKVRHGRVILDVPERRTHGMSFEVDASWQVNSLDAQVYVATRYAGKQPGAKVSRHYAATSKRGTACWNGTTGAHQKIKVRVDRFRQRAFDGTPGWAPRAYALRTLDAPGRSSWERLYKGVVAGQEAWTCPG